MSDAMLAQRYRDLFEISRDGVLLSRPDGAIIDVNPALIAILGYPRAELLQRNEADLWANAADRDAQIAALTASGSLGAHEVRLRARDGSLRDCLVSATALREPSGAAAAFQCVVHDLTGRHRTEDQLRAAFQYARGLIEASLDALVTISPDGKITDVNKASEEATGIPRDQLIGTDFRTYFTDAQAARAGYEQALREGAVRDYPLTIRHSSGRLIDVLYNATVYRNASGELQGVFAAARDITQRKRAEQELRAVNEQLSAVVAASPMAIVATDLERRVSHWNPAAERQFGWKAEEMIGHTLDDIVPEELRSEFMQRRGAVEQSRAADRQETVRVRKDGSRFPVYVSMAPMIGGDGNLAGIISVDVDISEQRHATDELRRLNAELEKRVHDRTVSLEAANKELEAFAYSVSHDLRAPLRAMDGFSQALVEDYAKQLDEHARDYLGRIRAASQQMGRLIDDLLDLSRLTRGDMYRTATDVTAIATAAVNELRQREAGRAVQVTVQEGMTAACDPRLLRIVFDNLVGNAWKFTRKQAAPRIEIGSTEKDGRPLYYVRDNGVGFDMQYVDKIFRPFQRLHSAADFEGNGIGLATVQRIVHRHGGTVAAEGKVGEGATFYFTLG